MGNRLWSLFYAGAIQPALETEQIIEMLKQGQIQFTDFAWSSGFTRWYRIYEVPDFAAAMSPAPDVPIPSATAPKTPPPPQPVAPPTVLQPAVAVPAPAPVIVPVEAAAPVPPTTVAVAPPPQPKEPLEKTIEVDLRAAANNGPQPSTTRRMWRVPIDATLRISSSTQRFKLSDISEGGCLFETPSQYKIDIGTDIKLVLESPNFSKALEMTAIVVREEQVGDTRSVGIEFTRVNPAHKRALNAYISARLQIGKAA